MLHGGQESRADDRAQLVYGAARDLGLLDASAPTLAKPDHLVVLGGLATGVEPRVRHAAELIERGAVSTGQVVALGAFRPLDERERDAASRYAPGACTELDLLAAMTGVAFGAGADWTTTTEGDPLTDPARAQETRRRHGEPEITLYAARSSDPDHRAANTVDTYNQFAHDVDLQLGQSLLIITSTIYAPYQHLDALRALGPDGVTIKTSGVPSRPDNSRVHPPSAYLQELRSTLRSAQALLTSLP